MPDRSDDSRMPATGQLTTWLMAGHGAGMAFLLSGDRSDLFAGSAATSVAYGAFLCGAALVFASLLVGVAWTISLGAEHDDTWIIRGFRDEVREALSKALTADEAQKAQADLTSIADFSKIRAKRYRWHRYAGRLMQSLEATSALLLLALLAAPLVLGKV